MDAVPAALQRRREEAAAAFGRDSPPVLIGAGEPIGKPGGQDQTYPFIPHPEYHWLTACRRSGGVLAFDPREGWTHFVRPVDAVERLWEGDPPEPRGTDVALLPDWVGARAPRRAVGLGVPPPGFELDAERTDAWRDRLDMARRPKDAVELALIDRAVQATVAGHARAREAIRPGASERRICIEIEAEMFRHGATGVGYDTIVGAGAHAAVLHFAPGERTVAAGDLVLVDAGAELDGYTADVTRTYPAGDTFTPRQQAIYDIVLAAEIEAISHCRPGVEWHDVHRAAARVLARGLLDLGILRGDVDGLLESEAIALLFPHGVGHMLGLGVRDVGGRAPGRAVGRACCGAVVRVDLPLGERFLMTVEPGLYFVPAILDDPERRARHRDAVAWSEVERWRDVGGVRIEDDVLVAAAGPQVRTSAIPK